MGVFACAYAVRHGSPTVPVALAAATALLAALAGCAPQEVEPTASQPAGASCTKDALTTKTPGKLTIGTDDPAYEPWFVDNKPDNGEGFESRGRRTRSPSSSATPRPTWSGPGSRSTTRSRPGRRPSTSTSTSSPSPTSASRRSTSPRRTTLVRQTVIALKGSKIAGATTLADLKDAKLGAQVGTTSYQAITDVIKPTSSRRSSTPTTTPRRRCRTARSTASWWTCRPRSTSPPRSSTDGDDRRAAAAGRRAGAVRPGAGQGLAADRLRQPGGRPAARGRHARASWRRSGSPQVAGAPELT